MFERVATILGCLAILTAVGIYAWPRLFAERPQDVRAEGVGQLDPGRVLAAVAAAGGPGPAPSPPRDSDRVAQLALRNATAENVTERIDLMRAEIEENGESAVRLGALGWLLVLNREPEEAKVHLERALALDPRCPIALVATAYDHMRHGRFRMAEAPLRRALAESPRVAEWHRMLGVIHLTQNRPLRALRRAERSVLLDPADCQGFLAVGDVHLRAARFAEAVAWYEAAIELAGGPETEIARRHEPVLAALRERAAKR